MTIDGVIRREEADSDGFKYGGWFFPVAVRGDGGPWYKSGWRSRWTCCWDGRPLTVGKRIGRRIRTSGQTS